MAGRVAALSAQSASGIAAGDSALPQPLGVMPGSDITAGDSTLPQPSGVMPGSSEPQTSSAARPESASMDIDAQGTPEAGDSSMSRPSSSPQASVRVSSADAAAGGRSLSRQQEGSRDVAIAHESQTIDPLDSKI